jgi:pimeloyl-ACP methyl ester carboxylesterase
MSRCAANGIEIEYESFGRESDPCLLLIMGLGSQMVLWDDALCERLAMQGFRVIRFDNRDAGRSTWMDAAGTPEVLRAVLASGAGRPVKSAYTLHDMAADAAGVLSALGIARAHVVGASMGAGIAQLLAIHHGERVLSLVSIMSSTGENAAHLQTSTEIMSALTAPAPSERAAFVSHTVELARLVSGGKLPFDTQRATLRAERTFDRGVRRECTLRQFVASLASGSRASELGTIRAPTLVIHGDCDPLAPLEGGRATAAAIPGAELLILPGMGHDLPPEVWDTVVPAITRNAARAAAG